jgi:hypothetical protein
MITGIREKTIVKENGSVEIPSSDLPIGTEVEVIILVVDDTTKYLLSSEERRNYHTFL